MILYNTIRQECVAEQVIEKSKFITYIKPVETREEADEYIKMIKKKHKDATHNVPAMVIGDKFQIQWASDDGEPSGTSGAPILQMLVKENITNVVVVVTRYFGGIKLGTGGLVRAYTSSAKLGLEKAGVCHVKNMASLTFKLDYTFLQNVQKSIQERGCEIENLKYEEKITIQFLTEPENVANIIEHVASVTSGRAELVDNTVKVVKVNSNKKS